MALTAAINTALMLASTPAAARFRRALSRPEATQRAILAGYLRRNAQTVYGRLHDFAGITSAEEFQRRVPISDYEDYRPYIDRIAAGERRVLTAENVRRFAPTSGSAGAEKWIPYTRSLAAEFRRGISPWLANLYSALPALRGGPAYWSITPVGPRNARPSKVPVGFDEDSAYLGGMFKRLVDSTFAVPAELRHVQDMETFRYLTLLCLLRARELRLISVWHPSFLTLLLDAAEAVWDRLLADIHDGAARPPAGLPRGVERAMRRLMRPDPSRSAELRHLGPRAAGGYWPSLALLSCWTDSHARKPAQELAERFPTVVLQGKGLLSTEAFVSIPIIDGARTHYPLAIRSHFFEFLPECGPPVLPHAAEPGGIYTILISTGGGLYRYNTHDRVRIIGRHHQTPCLEFLGKSDLVCDLFGEKLNAVFVQDVLNGVAKLLNPAPSFMMLAPDGPGYTLFIEPVGSLPPSLAVHLDASLSRNPQYDYCRRLGQLCAARIFQTQSGAAAAYIEACRCKGQRLGDIKPTPLHRSADWSSIFLGRHLSSVHMPVAPNTFEMRAASLPQ